MEPLEACRIFTIDISALTTGISFEFACVIVYIQLTSTLIV